MKTERLLYKAGLRDSYGEQKKHTRVDSIEEANLRSSEVEIVGWKNTLLFNREPETLHAPALDIDGIHCEVVPSSTKGNYHLYIDKPMSWENYKKLLKVLVEVGILEEDYYKASIADGKTFLRVKHDKHDK